MKIKHIIAAMALSLPALLFARPADPRPRTILNPDGSEVTVRVHGNEFFHFMTDVDCTRILERDAKGFVADAVRQGVILDFSKSNIEMLRMEAEADFPILGAPSSRSTMQKMATLDNQGRSNYPTIGKGNRSLVVLVEFQDVSFTVKDPKDYFTRQLNEPGFSDYGGYGSALDYYIDASNGLYAPQFDVLGPVKISKNASYFAGMGDKSMELLIKEALTELHDNGEVDFSDYDLDEDGIIDTVFFYYAGYGSADSETETIWPHQFDYRYLNSYYGSNNLMFDGKKMGPYACANELKGWNPNTGKQPWQDGSEPWVDGIGAFVHEYGHVLGLPDLYDTAYTEGVVVDTPGRWSIMAEGSYNFNGCRPPLMSAYEQWLCRWLEFTDAQDDTHYDLKALGNSEDPMAVRVRIPVSEDGGTFASEYFVIESRDNSKWDSCFPSSGLLVWRINYNKNNWFNNTVNSSKGSNVQIVYAKNQSFPVFTEGVIYGGAGVGLTPSKEYPFWKSPTISGIAYDASSSTGSFDYNMIVPSDLSTVLHDVPEADPDGSRSFLLTWDPVEGVDNYLVTVRIKKSGRVIADFDAKNVGKANSVWVEGLSSTYWRFELEAFVQCVVDGLPAVKYSNIVTFKPSELPFANAAVDAVGDDIATISGGIGCINAPDGSRIFDMHGHQISSAQSLAPGIYIVRYGSRIVKVLVR